MINVRKGVFETNSSSTHSMCIYNENPRIIPDKVEFMPGEFGWELAKLDTIYEKASYLYTSLLICCGVDEAQETIRNALEPEGVECVFEDPIPGSWGFFSNCYIDHGACLEFVQEMRTNSQAMLRFLFHPDSYVVTGNDNCYEDDWNWYEELAHPDGNYDCYERDN